MRFYKKGLIRRKRLRHLFVVMVKVRGNLAMRQQ